ncbi:hypothetical protein AB0M61_01930 [Streptomyces sp. NPDC051642]|uniref:hypothetical protein n=1 Tax=Streptomyces sp. NPDC051642 TaxID=3154646 RepID=UPI00343459C7
MTGHTHSLAEWFAFLCLGIGGWAAGSALLYLICDADPSDFDPRPAVRRTAKAAHQGVVDAGHDLNRLLAVVQRAAALSLRDAALSLAALLSMLLTAPSKGATS